MTTYLILTVISMLVGFILGITSTATLYRTQIDEARNTIADLRQELLTNNSPDLAAFLRGDVVEAFEEGTDDFPPPPPAHPLSKP